MRVRPEVSELSSEGSIVLNGFNIPAITTRRAETTIELGSGQSFMIGGLMRNSNVNSTDKAPGLGDLPILGAMFRSNRFRRQETELMIVVTPYLVKPTDANNIKLPTDGYLAPTDAQRLLLGKTFGGRSGEERPKPTVAPPITVDTRGQGVPLSLTTPPATPSQQGQARRRGVDRPGLQQVRIAPMRVIKTIPLIALVALAACGGTKNRGLESVHQPVVHRTDYVYDVPASGLSVADREGLDGWFRP